MSVDTRVYYVYMYHVMGLSEQEVLFSSLLSFSMFLALRMKLEYIVWASE